jgi:hypothetical protein
LVKLRNSALIFGQPNDIAAAINPTLAVTAATSNKMIPSRIGAGVINPAFTLSGY